MVPAPAETPVTPQAETQPAVEATAPVVVNFPTDHLTLMSEAGISPADYGAVEYIVSNESGWNALIYNRSGSGAYGMCQALPGSKMASAGADWATNPVTQLVWCNSYAISRYGGWWAAQAYWVAHSNW